MQDGWALRACRPPTSPPRETRARSAGCTYRLTEGTRRPFSQGRPFFRRSFAAHAHGGCREPGSTSAPLVRSCGGEGAPYNRLRSPGPGDALAPMSGASKGASRCLPSPTCAHSPRSYAARRRIYYGWWLILGSMVAVGILSGIAIWSFTLFVEPLEVEFGWSRAQVVLGASLAAALTGGVSSPFVGRWVDGARTATRNSCRRRVERPQPDPAEHDQRPLAVVPVQRRVRRGDRRLLLHPFSSAGISLVRPAARDGDRIAWGGHRPRRSGGSSWPCAWSSMRLTGGVASSSAPR